MIRKNHLIFTYMYIEKLKMYRRRNIYNKLCGSYSKLRRFITSYIIIVFILNSLSAHMLKLKYIMKSIIEVHIKILNIFYILLRLYICTKQMYINRNFLFSFFFK